MSLNNSGSQHKRILKSFLVQFLPVAGVILVFGLWFAHAESQKIRENFSRSEKVRVASSRHLIRTDIENHLRDVNFIAWMLRGQLAETGLTSKIIPMLAGQFKEVLRARPGYDQIRLLDVTGMERIRVDNKGKNGPVASQLLQDKSDRYYFINAMSTPPGHIYVSPMDLNEEHGALEIPIKPTIRFAKPVRDGSGNTLGVVVLNFHGRKIFNQLQRMEEPPARLFLVDFDGFWFMGPTPEHEWGRQLPDREHSTIRELFPQAWGKMQRDDFGQFETDAGLFTYASIMLQAPLPYEEINDQWFVISYVPSPLLSPSWLRAFYTMTAGIMLFIALMFWLLTTSRVRKKAAEDQARSTETKIAALADSAYDAIVMIDSKAKITFWNKASESLFGYNEKEALGRDVHELITPIEDREQAELGMAKFAKSGTGRIVGSVVEMTALRKDGVRIPIERSVSSFQHGDKWFAAATIRDITERKKAERRLKELATTDSLTGLFNRRKFLEISERELLSAKRYKRPLCVMMLDIDHFKKVNDTYGHDGGDEVLRAIASIMQQSLRESDAVGRLGGEEFAAILPETDIIKAGEVGERIRKAVEAHTSLTADNEEVRVTISIGIATHCMSTPDMDSMLKSADTALYRAKELGRNRIETEAGENC